MKPFHDFLANASKHRNFAHVKQFLQAFSTPAICVTINFIRNDKGRNRKKENPNE